MWNGLCLAERALSPIQGLPAIAELGIATGSIRDACISVNEPRKEGAMQRDTVEDALSAFASENTMDDASARIGATPVVFETFRVELPPARRVHRTAIPNGVTFFLTTAAVVVAVVLWTLLSETAALARWTDSAATPIPPVQPPKVFVQTPPSTGAAPVPDAESAAPADGAPQESHIVAPPASPVVAPPASSVVAASPASPETAEMVESVVMRYLGALTAFDVASVKAAMPRADERALRADFARLDEQQFELSGCDVRAVGRHADASCTGIYRYVPKRGSKTMFVERRHWKFQLRSGSQGWFIDNVAP